MKTKHLSVVNICIVQRAITSQIDENAENTLNLLYGVIAVDESYLSNKTSKVSCFGKLKGHGQLFMYYDNN